MLVRVIDYTVDDGRENPDVYRLLTTMLDPAEAPAIELAAAYAQRWEIEITFDELKTHQRGPKVVLRSKSPDLVLQEIWGHLCCHYAIRTLMADAAHTPDTIPTGSASSPRCASPASPSPSRAPFPPEHPRVSRSALASLPAPTPRPPQPRPTATVSTPRDQTQNAQMARQTARTNDWPQPEHPPNITIHHP